MNVWLVAVVNDPEDVSPSPTLNVPPEPKIWLNAVVTSVLFTDVHGEALVGVQTKPLAVPGGKPETVVVPPTLPVTTELPVFETPLGAPPKSPKELAGDGIDKIGLPKAGATAAATVTNQSNLRRILA